jgi:hypothetical protein
MSQPLRLEADDAEDLTVIAACLQDALVLVGDMAFLPEEQRFVLVANRFVWEAAAHEDGEAYARTSAGLSFDKVAAVKQRNLDRSQTDAILSLLTIRQLPGAIELVFSGEAVIRLETNEVQCHLADLGETWPTRWRPQHALD